ncbi:MAG: type IV pilus biogenesis/stability protein PilW [Pseudomonadota bacterium]
MKRLAVVILMLLLAGCAAPAGNSFEQQARARSSAGARVHTELAAQYYDRTQYGVALEEVARALAIEPNYAPAYNVRGLVHMALREDEQAEADFLHGLDLDARDSEGANNYGWFLCQRGRERESVKWFLTALKNPLYTTPAKAYLNAGVCSRKAGDMRQAEGFLRQALTLQPEMPEALLNLADFSYASGDLPGAKSYFLRYVQSLDNAPLSAENLWLGVRIERKLGDAVAEEKYAAQLRKRYPDARETQLMLYQK